MGSGRRRELTDAAWAVVDPLLPPMPRRRGRPRREHRTVVNGIVWVLAAGVAWRDAPESYGPGRKPTFDREQHRARDIVERVIGWLKNLCRIACRAEKLAVRYAGMVTLALIARTATGSSEISSGCGGFRDGGR